jgi:hypothetical protein
MKEAGPRGITLSLSGNDFTIQQSDLSISTSLIFGKLINSLGGLLDELMPQTRFSNSQFPNTTSSTIVAL